VFRLLATLLPAAPLSNPPRCRYPRGDRKGLLTGHKRPASHPLSQPGRSPSLLRRTARIRLKAPAGPALFFLTSVLSLRVTSSRPERPPRLNVPMR